MADTARQSKTSGKQRTGSRRKGLAASVPEEDAAEYTFALIRSLMSITRGYRDFRLTTYFLEMAAMEVAPSMDADDDEAGRQPSRRATS